MKTLILIFGMAIAAVGQQAAPTPAAAPACPSTGDAMVAGGLFWIKQDGFVAKSRPIPIRIEVEKVGDAGVFNLALADEVSEHFSYYFTADPGLSDPDALTLYATEAEVKNRAGIVTARAISVRIEMIRSVGLFVGSDSSTTSGTMVLGDNTILLAGSYNDDELRRETQELAYPLLSKLAGELPKPANTPKN